MTKVEMNKALHKAKLAELFTAISNLKDANEASQFLIDLCTPAELEAMADRWQVVAEIIAEKPYRKIHEETGVSITTIGRVARCISYGTGGYQLIFNRLRGKHAK